MRTQGDLPRRGNHTVVVYKNSLFVYGGRDGDKDYDDLWELKLCTEPPPAPSPDLRVRVRNTDRPGRDPDLGGADWQKVVLSEPASPTARSGHTWCVTDQAQVLARSDESAPAHSRARRTSINPVWSSAMRCTCSAAVMMTTSTLSTSSASVLYLQSL